MVGDKPFTLGQPAPDKQRNPMMNLLRSYALVTVLGLASLGQALAATYFVNSNGGNDSYNGGAPAWTGGSNGPWQTLAKLAAVTLAPNDTVYLACGGVWNETLRVPSSGATNVPITIAGGPGVCAASPLIDGAVPIPAHQWVQHSGAVYKAKLPIDLISNPNPGISLAGWSQWSASGNTTMATDNACPSQTAPCIAFTSGNTNSVLISNSFAVVGGIEYSAGVHVRAAQGTLVKVVVRRAGPPYEKLAPDEWITGAGAWQSVGIMFRATTSVSAARLDIEVPAPQTRINIREAHVQRAVPGAGLTATFVDTLPIRRAHHPNFGQNGDPSSPFTTIATGGGKFVLDASGLALPAGAALSPGLGVTMRTIDWAIEERLIAGVSGSRLTLSAPTSYEIQSGYGFFLTGARWMLDSPGEWFYDAAATTIYVWMPDGSAPGNRVAVTGVAFGADLAGKSNLVLKDIAVRHVGTGVTLVRSRAATIAGVTISDTADNGINAENCIQCSVQRSSIARSGLDAISVPGGLASGFALTDSTITDSGASVRTDGWRMLPRMAEAAVYAIGPSTTVARNTITGAAKIAVHGGSTSTITDNYLGKSCLTLNDCSAIYVGRIGSSSTITGNVVDGVFGGVAGLPVTLQPRAVGIYLDDLNANSIVTGNTVTGADYGVQLHNASGATVSNNLLFGNRRHQLWMHENTGVVRSQGDMFANRIVSNLMVPTASGPAVFALSELGDTLDFATFSGNHYSALLSQRVLGEQSPTTGSSYTVAEWQAASREAGAQVTQPVGYASFLVGAVNLVPNGDLANSIAGWTWWNQTAPFATAAIAPCGFAPCVEMRAGASPSLLTSPNFSVVAGQWYRVSFDAAVSAAGQSINVVVRRGGGGSAGYETLMPAGESFAGSTSWRRYSFAFQALKTVTAGDPVTDEFGARVDFERNQPGTVLKVAKLEMVTLVPAQVPLQLKLLLNRGNRASSLGCEVLGVATAACSKFAYFSDDSPVVWPALVPALSGTPIYTRDTSLTDTDRDGIADQQDACPNTVPGNAVNARGCTFGQ